MLRRIVRSYLQFVASCYRVGHDLGRRTGVALADPDGRPGDDATRALKCAIWTLAREADAAATAGRFDRARTLAWGLRGGMANVARAAGNGGAALAHLKSAAALIRDLAPGSLHEGNDPEPARHRILDTFLIEAAVDAHARRHCGCSMSRPQPPPSPWNLSSPGRMPPSRLSGPVWRSSPTAGRRRPGQSWGCSVRSGPWRAARPGRDGVRPGRGRPLEAGVPGDRHPAASA